MKSTLNLAPICLALLAAQVAWGQANVNESAETALLYVNGSTGSDSNPGTQQEPFKTISKAENAAISNNKNSIGTKVTISPGTYREGFVYWGGSNNKSVPITLQAATPGTVTVSGADVWTGWKTYSGNTQIFTHSWPYQWGFCPLLASTEADIVRRREMIFVNGKPLTQVLALAQMVQGTFYVKESTSTVYVWPPSGTNMSSATVEVATRSSLLEIHDMKNFVVRGINFQYANGCRDTQPAVIFTGESSNVLIDTDKFLWNNSVGLSMNSVSYVTIQNSVANHNGETGMTAYQAKYSAWNSDEGSYNNWRGAQGAFYGVEAGGAKWLEMHEGTYNGFKANFNVGVGVHWDTDNMNITANSLDVSKNFWSAASIEATQGPFTISNSIMCNNNPENWPYSGGVELVDAANVSMSDDTFYNNGTVAVLILGRPGGIAVTNYETNQQLQVYNENMTLRFSVMDATGSQQVFHDGYTGTDWSRFADSLVSDDNTWWNPNTSADFSIGTPASGTMVNFAKWQSVTGQDAHSTFAAPATNPASSCAVTPDAADFWFVGGPNTGSITVNPGGKAAYAVSIVPVNFSGTISLKSGLQIPGATGSFSVGSVNSSGNATFTVTTSSSTPAGTYDVTMIATGGGLARTLTFPLVVN